MQKRQVIRLVVFLLIILNGCSVGRKSRTGTTGLPAEAGYAEIISSIVGNNITEQGFILKKGRIELDGTELDGSFGITARLNKKGDFTASVKGPLGIELARLINVGNEIALIDRINRTVYLGKKDEVMRRKGMPEDFLKIIFGDLPDEALKMSAPVNEGVIRIMVREKELERDISICLNEMKVCREEISSSGSSDRQISLVFNNFIFTEGGKYASLIQIEEKAEMFHVKLNIDELITGYDSEIDFALPSYKRVSL